MLRNPLFFVLFQRVWTPCPSPIPSGSAHDRLPVGMLVSMFHVSWCRGWSAICDCGVAFLGQTYTFLGVLFFNL